MLRSTRLDDVIDVEELECVEWAGGGGWVVPRREERRALIITMSEEKAVWRAFAAATATVTACRCCHWPTTASSGHKVSHLERVLDGAALLRTRSGGRTFEDFLEKGIEQPGDGRAARGYELV